MTATKKTTTKTPAEKTKLAKATKTATPKEKKLSALSAAAKVLTESGTAMTTKEMIEAMATRGYWTSPGGRTPHATIYAAILREIATKGKDARFQKTERGKFAASGTAETDPIVPIPTPPKAKQSKKAKKAAAAISGGTPGSENEAALLPT